MDQTLEVLKSKGVIKQYETISGGVTEHHTTRSENFDIQHLAENRVESWKTRTDNGETSVFGGDRANTGVLKS